MPATGLDGLLRAEQRSLAENPSRATADAIDAHFTLHALPARRCRKTNLSMQVPTAGLSTFQDDRLEFRLPEPRMASSRYRWGNEMSRRLLVVAESGICQEEACSAALLFPDRSPTAAP